MNDPERFKPLIVVTKLFTLHVYMGLGYTSIVVDKIYSFSG